MYQSRFRNTHGKRFLLNCMMLFCCWVPLAVSANGISDVMGSDAPCYDTDGDGYGWNGSANCPPFLGTVNGQVARLVSEVGDIEDFGSNVLIDGNRMLIGNGRDVFVLNRDAGRQWSLVTTLSISDPENTGDSYIFNFAMQGNTMVLADENASTTTPIPGTPYTQSFRSGAVYVFTDNNGSWTPHQKLVPSDPQSFERFGDSIALAGDLLLVGAPDKEREDAFPGPGVSPFPRIEGAVYVFRRNGQGQWIEEAIIERDDDFGSFGRSVSLDGNGTAIIGSSYDISPYVFQRVAPGDWREVGRLASIEAAIGPVRSFALDSETLLVGTTGERFGEFQVYAYTNNGDGTYSQSGQSLSDGSNTFVVNGNTALVERQPDDLDVDSDIEVFKRSTAGVWQLQNTLKSSLDDHTSFGHRFSVSGNTVVAGASANFTSLFNRGSVYVFDISQPNDGQRNDSSCIEPDEDGWGWNPTLGISCNINANTGSITNTDSNTGSGSNSNAEQCIDSDGDGWGWDGMASCRVTDAGANAVSDDGTGCDYIDADQFNGWGWNPIEN